jgi:hypothetical protein
MRLELNDIQTEALIRELTQIIDNDRYPLSPRIVVLKEILGDAPTGAHTRAPTPAAALRAADQGAIPAATVVPEKLRHLDGTISPPHLLPAAQLADRKAGVC